VSKHYSGVERPWSVQVELTEGCNRLCSFCGLNGIRTGPGCFKFMTIGIAERTAMECASLCPTARYEFAMHGEPLANPKYLEILRIFRAYLPKAQMQVTTNGRVLMKTQDGMNRRLRELLGVVDFVLVDTYEPERTKLQQMLRASPEKVLDFYSDLAPRGVSPWANNRRKGELQGTVIILDDLGERDGEVASRVILNHAGNNGQTIDKPLAKTCTNPFREVSVAYDGNVNICCMDWGHEYVCGNVMEDGLEKIWWGDRFTAARAFLQAKRREFTPCNRCNKGSGTRCGLLPKMGPVTEQDELVVRQVVATAKPRNGKKAEVLF
jgi:radical SAM protein with 4Fe4S-binding SPASM domain